jgi:hypothetical protein
MNAPNVNEMTALTRRERNPRPGTTIYVHTVHFVSKTSRPFG